MSAKARTSGHTTKHVSSRKHTATSKHHPSKTHKPVTHKAAGHKVTVKGTHAHHAKAAGFAVGDWLPVCAFEAVAMSLRLAGQPVHGDEVCRLWHLLGEPAEGVPVGEALAAAALFGLNGYRPVPYPVHGVAEVLRGEYLSGTEGLSYVTFPQVGVHLREMALDEGVNQIFGHGLILHVDVPGPHAVLATTDGWWSWGELHDPWPCRIEGAWAVSWS